MALPDPREDQSYVRIQPIVAGTLTLPEWAFITPVDPTIKHMVPSLCFLVEHSAGKEATTRFMFDLGLRGAPEDYIPEIQAHLPNRQPVTHRPSAPETLQKNGIPPESIQMVLLSHVHWDHHGDPARFPHATFVVGHGSLDVLERGMGDRGSHSHFDPNLFRDVTAVEFSSPTIGAKSWNPKTPLPKPILNGDSTWEPLGPFPASLDLFGDGSVYVIPAPGHLPGHINLLCRSGPGEWTYLGGDVFHDKRLLTGEKQISTWEDQGRTYCVHIDREEAEASIARIRSLQDMCSQQGQKLEVVVAHDNGWYEANRHRCMA